MLRLLLLPGLLALLSCIQKEALWVQGRGQQVSEGLWSNASLKNQEDTIIYYSRKLECKDQPCSTEDPKGKPVVCIEGGNRFVLLFENVKVTCRAKHTETNFQLMANGKVVHKDDFRVEKKACRTTYTFIRSKGCYSGKTFSCFGRNNFGSTQSTENINVTFLLSVKIASATKFFIGKTDDQQKGANKHLIQGATGILTCNCMRCINFQGCNFYVQNNTHEEWRLITNSIHPRFNIATNKMECVLAIRNVTRADARSYGCQIVDNDYHSCPAIKSLAVKTGECSAGHYCSMDSMQETPCPKGTYNPRANVFGKSGCLSCPQGKYCPRGSIQAISCKASNIFSDKNESFPLRPAESEADCRRCPLKQPCSLDKSCSLVCPTRHTVNGVVGDTFVELSCVTALNSNVHEMKLKWKKNGKEIGILKHSKYIIYRSKDLFTLRIKSVKLRDAGLYNCEAIYPGYLNKQTREITLQVRTKLFDRKYLFLLLLILPIIGGFFFLIQRKDCFSKLMDVCFNNSVPSSNSGLEFRSYVDIFATRSSGESWTRSHPDSGGTKDGMQETYDFDAFVCCSDKDKDWIHKEMKPTLEKSGLRLCLHFRDFEAGGTIIDNIVDAIYKSRKTIVVLSPEFLGNKWCDYELEQAIASNRKNLVPVLFRTCKIPPILENITYLDWTDEDVKVLFWEKLINTVRQ